MIPRVGDSIICGSEAKISPQPSGGVARAFIAWPTEWINLSYLNIWK